MDLLHQRREYPRVLREVAVHRGGTAALHPQNEELGICSSRGQEATRGHPQVQGFPAGGPNGDRLGPAESFFQRSHGAPPLEESWPLCDGLNATVVRDDPPPPARMGSRETRSTYRANGM